MIIRDKIKNAPGLPGVYLFTNKSKILYVGKAVNIKARLRSHLENAKLDRKEDLIISQSDSIEWITTDSEFKALLLEAKLIRTHHPKYNVRWKDDKSYLYIRIDTREDYPKVQLSRKERDKYSKYFGPFPSVKSTESILREIRKIYPFCTQKKLSSQACFYSKIKLCNPCPNKIEYLEDSIFKTSLKKLYRHNIRQAIKILSGKTDEALKDLRIQLELAKKIQDYEKAILIRNRINNFEKLILQASFLKDNQESYNQSEGSLEALKILLQIHFFEIEDLSRIECYDISNLTQREATASMVVLTKGLPDRGEYRKFKIKRLGSRSDFEMLDEVLRRRFKNKWTSPNLIIVDGGKPQVRLVLKTLSNIGEDIRVIGIAKNPDRLIIGRDYLPTIRPASNNLGFNLIRHIRDESHRFAKKYHIHLRKKGMLV